MSGINLSSEERDIARIVLAIIQIMQGRSNAVLEVTLTPNVTTTVVSAVNFGRESYPFPVALTANAAAALATMYVSARSQGSFTMTHANNAQTDRTFGFLGIG